MKKILELTMLMFMGIQTLLCAQAPAVPTGSLTFSAVTGHSVKLDVQPGDGEGRVILARKGAVVDAVPVNGKVYQGKAEFGKGAVIGVDNYVVLNGTNQNVVVTNLEPNTVYHFACFEYINTSAPVYIQTAATVSLRTHAGPTSPVATLALGDIEGNSFDIVTNGGDGSRRLIILKKGSEPNAIPENGTIYRADARFGSGFEIAPGEFVVQNAGDNTTRVTNLEPGASYYLRIYSYDADAAGFAYYLKDKFLNGQAVTAAKPNNQAEVTPTDITGASATLLFNNVGGKYRIITMRQNEPVTSQPADLVRYTGGNKDFGKGAQLGAGNYIIAGSMNGNSFTVTNLKAGLTYYAQVSEFNGYYAPVYLTPGAVVKIEIPIEPDKPASDLGVQQVEGSSLRPVWKKGSGARRLIIARKNEPVTALPQDGVTYKAGAVFGSGDQLAEGEFVVYDGTDAGFGLKGLEALSVYHLAIFEYNLPEDKPNYRTSTYLSGFVSTIPYPTTQTSNITLQRTESHHATIRFVKGNGEKRLFVMRRGSAAAVEPVDFKRINVSGDFGQAEIGPGNYAVYAGGSGTEFTVNHLSPGVTYQVSAYEFNGVLQPAYLRPASTYSFTMPGQKDTPANSPAIAEREGNRLRLSWQNGGGENRLVVARKGAVPDFRPVAGKTYTFESAFGRGEHVGGGNYVVYNGPGNSVLVSNLLPSSEYYFAVFEYTGVGQEIGYQTEEFLQTSGATASAPAAPGRDLIATPTANSVLLRWTKGSGEGRIVVFKEENAVVTLPADLTAYAANAVFKSGQQIGAGGYVVYDASGSEVSVSGLQPDKLYHFTILERNGSQAPVYNRTLTLTGSVKTNPALPVTWIYFKAKATPEGNALEWATSQESNSDYFVVERSLSPQVGFVAVDTAHAAGDSHQMKTYHFVDAKTNATVYYRLKQVDRDGKYSYSRIVNINEGKSDLILYPNPVTDKLYLTGDHPGATLRFFDQKGNLIKNSVVQKGQYLNVSTFPAGIYTIIIETGNRKSVHRIIKN